MKKSLFILVAMLIGVTACEKSTYTDGTYMWEYSEASHDWFGFLEFTLTEDVISAVNYDYKNADGALKSTDSAYNASMLDIKGTNPETFLPLIEKAIMDVTIVPEFEGLDAVTGATSSTGRASALLEAALNSAMEGGATTGSIVLPVEEE